PGGDRRALEMFDFERKYQSLKSGQCFTHASLRIYPMLFRTIEQSHRPRVSDRTMCCYLSSGQRLGLLCFRITMGAVTTAKWNHKEEQLLLRFTFGDEAIFFI